MEWRAQTTGRALAVLENPRKVSNLEQQRRCANSTLPVVVVRPPLRMRAVLQGRHELAFANLTTFDPHARLSMPEEVDLDQSPRHFVPHSNLESALWPKEKHEETDVDTPVVRFLDKLGLFGTRTR